MIRSLSSCGHVMHSRGVSSANCRWKALVLRTMQCSLVVVLSRVVSSTFLASLSDLHFVAKLTSETSIRNLNGPGARDARRPGKSARGFATAFTTQSVKETLLPSNPGAARRGRRHGNPGPGSVVVSNTNSNTKTTTWGLPGSGAWGRPAAWKSRPRLRDHS